MREILEKSPDCPAGGTIRKYCRLETSVLSLDENRFKDPASLEKAKESLAFSLVSLAFAQVERLKYLLPLVERLERKLFGEGMEELSPRELLGFYRLLAGGVQEAARYVQDIVQETQESPDVERIAQWIAEKLPEIEKLRHEKSGGADTAAGSEPG